MRFFVDDYFQIGQGHYHSGKPCQDHALSYVSGNMACAIVSDGCSTGGNTDIGARITTLATRQAIHDHVSASLGSLDSAPFSILARQQQLFQITRPLLGLERKDMLATCAYVYATKQGALLHVEGDGVIAFKYLDGTFKMRRYDWEENTPFYPSYEGDDLAAFVGAHGGDISLPRLKVEELFRQSNGEWTQFVFQYSLGEGLLGITTIVTSEELSRIQYIAVFTDGVCQIKGVDWQDSVIEFLSFKNNCGEFLKRRMRRAVENFEKNGFEVFDDLSAAVIKIEREETERSVYGPLGPEQG